MTTEATVLHGRLLSAHGNTASPTPRSGDEKLHGPSTSSKERRERSSAQDKDDATSARSARRGHSTRSSFPYRDMIKSVLSHVMATNEISTASTKGRADIKDKQVEDVVRGLAMEEWNTRWLDELVAKVKGERKLKPNTPHMRML